MISPSLYPTWNFMFPNSQGTASSSVSSFPHSVSMYAHPQCSARRNAHLSAARQGVRTSAARRDAHRPLVARHAVL